MASGQYFKGFVLLVILMRNPELVSSQSSTTGVSESPMPSVTPPMTTASGSMISCRQFNCNGSDCYTMFMNQTAMACGVNSSYCSLQRLVSMSYSVGCSDDCPTTACANATQTGCSVACCNTTDCLNGTLFSMVPTTVAPTTTPKTTPKPTTPANNGKKCHKLSCTGEKCYTKADQKTKVMLCPVGQDYCWLKKTVSGAVMTWMASCSGDCRQEDACTSTAVDCTQECCNATKTSSCLKLDGTLNTPNSLAPHLAPVPILSLLAAALLAWLAGSQIHAQ